MYCDTMIDKLIENSDSVEGELDFLKITVIKKDIIYMQKKLITAMRAIRDYW